MTDYADLDRQFDKAISDQDVPTQDVDVEIAQIVRLLRIDPEAFIEFFLAEQLDMPVPEFHKEIWGLLTDQEKERVLLAIPRDHAKTTLAKLVVIWYWLYTSHRFCVYLSNTSPIAKGACRDIRAFMTENQNFQQVFGKVRIIKSSENEGLWMFELTNPITGRVKTCILRALGQGQQMRGINIDNQRPDIAVVDDVEDNENTESETQQKKLDKWMFGPFIKALARKKKILWLGNMLTKTSLLARLSRSPRWNPVVFGALVKNTLTGLLEPLWPGKWSVEALQEDFKEYKDNGLVETWMCEMMNMPGHGENGFSMDMLNYQAIPTPDMCQCAWITIDPAFGQSAHNDETAICVHVIPKYSGVPMTVAIDYGRLDETTMFYRALALAQYWNAWVWGVEAVAAQRVLIPLFQTLFAMRGMVGAAEILPLMSGRGDPKISRIRSFVSLMANGEWALADTDVAITEQIVSFDFRKKDQPDDRVDSAAYGPIMMELYLAVIQARSSGEDWLNADLSAQYGMEVAGV
jgi:hypothetical protein